MKKFLATLLLSISTIASAQNVSPTGNLDPTQVYTTPNIVNNTTSPTDTTGTWQNLGLVNQGLPCWAPGGPIYCGPAPYFNNGSFNFSYGLTDVYQVASIANALPNLGAGLRVNGYNFGFTAKNGNGWDNGQQDYLSAYVNFYGSDGKSVRYDYYDLNYKFDWTQFNFSKTFDTPYASKDLSTVRYGFVGGDSNFWAGPYGPEIINVNFSLKYSVDPCAKDPLSSASCPGFSEALAKITATAPIEQQTTSTVVATNTITEPSATTQPTTTQTATQSTIQPVVQPAVQLATTTQPTAVSSNTQSSQSNSQQQTAGPSLSSVLNLIQSNARREQAIVATAVANANETAQTAVQLAEQTAINVATASSVASVASTAKVEQQFTAVNQTSSSSTQTMNAMAINPTSVMSTANNQSIQVTPSMQSASRIAPIQTTSNNESITVSLMSRPQNMNVQQSTSTQVITESSIGLLQGPNVMVVETSRPTTQTASTEIKLIQDNDLALFTNNFLTNRANPITEIVENNTRPSNTTVEQKDTVVNKNAGNNELAGGIDLERMALQPVGYNSYLQLAMRDVAFYAPKEIYRNQRVIDNQQAVRLLNFASELKHQEMVNQQYGEKK